MTTEQSTKRWLPATLLIAACAMFAGCTADGDVPPGGVADDGGGDGGGGSGGGGGDPTLTCVQPIGGAGASTTGSVSGLCVGCAVQNPDNAIDDDPDNFATLSIPVGLLGGTASLLIKAPDGVAYPAGNVGGTTLEIPAGLLALDLLQNVSLDFMLDDVEVESIEDPALLNLSALGIPLLGGGELVALSAPATTAFDAVQLNATAGVASLLSNVNVFGGCGEYVETGSAAAR